MLADGRVLVAGGSDTGSTRTASAELYTPLMAPSAPTHVSATAGDSGASVSWSVPSSDGGSPITGFVVTASPGGAHSAAPAGATQASVSGLANGTTYTLSVRAQNAIGDGPDSAPSNPVTPTLTAPPSLTQLRVNPTAFAAASRGATVARRRRRTGTTVSYQDSQPATTSFTVLRPASGRRLRGRCVKRTRRHRRGKRCTRYVSTGAFSHLDSAGANRFRFTGRIRNRKLRPGRYLLRATPLAGSRRGAAVRVRFRIVR